MSGGVVGVGIGVDIGAGAGVDIGVCVGIGFAISRSRSSRSAVNDESLPGAGGDTRPPAPRPPPWPSKPATRLPSQPSSAFA